ncbi:MAG: cell division protein FtsL [Betaproteobacteria bacterium]|jgi:cell division protein FtsL|nr:cell division protein FtsL [Betaproteobacteria bacterium]
MTRRQWFLVGLITASSLSLVNARYHERRLFTQMDRTERAGLKLDSDIEVLQVELTALRNPGRIDAAARRDLKMIPLRPTEPMYYRPNSGAGGMR